MADIFIGLVSHVGSRFAVSQGPTGLAAHLREAFTERDLSVEVVVNTANLWTATGQPVTQEDAVRTLDAEMAVMNRWARYLRQGRLGTTDTIRGAVRSIRRSVVRARRPTPDSVRRLLDIEASHLDLMARALASGSPWILILEDDAESADVVDCAEGLASLFARKGSVPAFVNVSESFTPEQLGIDHLLAPTDVPWAGTFSRVVLAAERPVTNTVCAVAYRRSFLVDLVSSWNERGLFPVVPIDWKLNDILMDFHRQGLIGAGDCWLVEPAPIRQMSMHEPASGGQRRDR